MPPKPKPRSKPSNNKPAASTSPSRDEASGPPSLRAVPAAARALGALAADGTTEPATTADVQSAAALPPATIEQATPPSIAQIQILGSTATQAALREHAGTLKALGHDGPKLAADAHAAIASGERTIRLFESAFRSLQEYQILAKALQPEMTALSKTLRGLEESSPLAKAFSSFIQQRDLVRGVPDARRTRDRTARKKAKDSSKAKGTPKDATKDKEPAPT